MRPAAIKGWAAIERAFVRRVDFSAEARFLGILLASFAGPDGIAFPGMKTLMGLTGWGTNRVKRARSELVKGGAIRRIQAKGGAGRFGPVRWFIGDEVLSRKHENCASGGNQGNRGVMPISPAKNAGLAAGTVYRPPVHRAHGPGSASNNYLSQSHRQ